MSLFLEDNWYSIVGWILGLLIVGICVVHPVVAANPGYSVSVTAVTPSKVVLPGDFVTLVFSVHNNGSVQDTYDFSLNKPERWSLVGKPPLMTLDSGEKQSVFVNLQVPSTSEAGSYTVELIASSDEVSNRASSAITIQRVLGVKVSMPSAERVRPGETVTYHASVTNPGNTSVQYRVEVTSSHGWVQEVTVQRLLLLPGGTKTVGITLAVPEGVQAERDALRVTATSVANPEIGDTGLLFTTLLPPAPQAVGGKMYELMPARLDLNFSHHWIEGGYFSGMSISFGGELQTGNTLHFSMPVTGLLSELSVGIPTLEYGRENLAVELGEVSLGLGNLVGLSGRGVTLSGYLKPVEYSFISAIGDEGVLGGSIGYSQNLYQLRAGLATHRQEQNYHQANASVMVQPITALTFQGEVATSITAQTSSAALGWIMNTTFTQEPLEFSGQAYTYGSQFRGTESDERGIRFSEQLDTGSINQSLSFAHFRENLARNPELPVTLTDILHGRFSYGPAGQIPQIWGQIDVTRRRDISSPPEINILTHDFMLGVQDSSGVLTYGLQATRGRDLNFITGSQYGSYTFRESIGASFNSLQLGFSLIQDVERNLNTNQIETVTTGATLQMSPTGSPLEFTLSRTGEEVHLQTAFIASLSQSTQVDIGVSFSSVDGVPNFSGSLDFTSQFKFPLFFVFTRGRLTGEVFIDENADGTRQPDEPGVNQAVLQVQDSQVSTNAKGFFKFPPFKPGKYKVDFVDLPVKYSPLQELPRQITISKGKVTAIQIPVQRVGVIRGRVYGDTNQNGSYESEEQGRSGLVVNLTGDQLSRSATTDSSGNFSFYRLSPGTYTLTLDKDSLPPRTSITTKRSLTVRLKSGQAKNINVGIFQKPKEIVFGRPPVPRFQFSPNKPVVGEQISFDASGSTDPDGKIKQYSWDFDEDNQPEAHSKEANYSYASPGKYTVQLTVVDNNGNSKSATKVIQVTKQ